tara:strand:+ start:16148 stop:16738 length:591 start_codon:yes stop_codon:yes gene_type:complete
MGLMKPPEWYWRSYVFRVGYFIIIEDTMYRVSERNAVFAFEKDPGSDWLLAANTEGTKTSISNYLDAGRNVLYGLMFGVYADRLFQIKVFKPGASQLGGIKNETNVPVNTLSSPLDDPQMLLFNFGNSKDSIEFTPKNLSGVTNKFIRIGGFGHKYLLEKVGGWNEGGEFIPTKESFTFPKAWTKVPTSVIKEVAA